ncbi:RNA-binding protein [Peptacetobacter hiranonis]|uniref:S4 domain protein n=1 Tax=Peptacetobacter hiranonis (strain DSM 13275 / JCM 10541 / KCTC 15199 / TO-931) TaxID=500633 RepID=B6FYW3_PEPHT|nr:RNA-binding protein [Peptacetobacter hiranonis]EEA85344.1 S4 domain protein [Peptacetobacter hiranonis DSM 13275]QEK20362.1 hypothetical protein KGNDJEFE_00845 [Peptacetobacter hiranonis]
MDKIRLTNHIKDIELKNKIFKLIDKANTCLKNYEAKSTEFMNPFEVKNAMDIINSESDLKYHSDGGYEGAERSVLSIYPFYMEYEDIEQPIKFIQIDGNFKFRSVSHKDYLGSLLGLGIKREKIGDILIHEDFCQVIVSSDICDYIVMNLTKVATNSVKVKEINREELKTSEKKYKDISFTVSSDRLDCVISGIYNISRQESLKYINAERVHLNYEKITSASKTVSSGDLISVRGKGRSEVVEIGGETRKGRTRVKARIIL